MTYLAASCPPVVMTACPAGKRSNLAHDLPAFGEDRRASSAVNRAIHATAAQK